MLKTAKNEYEAHVFFVYKVDWIIFPTVMIEVGSIKFLQVLNITNQLNYMSRTKRISVFGKSIGSMSRYGCGSNVNKR